jgi:hypothetical protein
VRRPLAVVGVLALVWLWCNPLPAGAAMNQVEAAQRGGGNAVTLAPQYYDFSNTTIPDCEYVADANLIEHEDPNVVISQDEVVAAHNTYGTYFYFDSPEPLNFLESTGFGGVTITGYAQLSTDVQVMAAANAGGVWALLSVDAPVNHVVAIVAANATGPVVVWFGVAAQTTWAWYDANMIVEYAVNWATS